MESKFNCDKYLNQLMMPATMLSAIATVMSSTVGKWEYGPFILAYIYIYIYIYIYETFINSWNQTTIFKISSYN